MALSTGLLGEESLDYVGILIISIMVITIIIQVGLIIKKLLLKVIKKLKTKYDKFKDKT